MKITAFFISILFLFSACTDSKRAKFMGLGNEFKVEVVSGGQIVRTYTSTGKVSSEQSSDGYYFMDKATGQLVEISGDVIITQMD